MNYRRAAAAVTLICTISIAGYHGVTLSHLSQTVGAAQSELKLQDDALAEAEGLQVELAAQAEELEDTITARNAVLAEREKFNASVGAASAALASADGKVDVAPQKERIIAAQNAVIGQLEDVDLMATQTAEVDRVTAEVVELVRSYEERVAEDARRSSGGFGTRSGSANGNPGSVSGGDWFSEMRSRLDSVGGGHVALFEYDGSCGGAQSPACAYGGRGIAVHPSIMELSDSRKSWAMAHELSHIYQLDVWSSLVNSAGYQNLFGGNIEFLANCMASAKGYSNHGHSDQCTAERVNYGHSIWSGIVP